MIPIVKKNETEIQWANGSFMIVAVSTRGRTLQWLHVSEYGKICAKYPEKQEEIMSGSLPSVDQNGIIVIESTAEGRQGDFYAKVMQAKANLDSGKRLTNLDYKLHFASWWDADEYQINPELVVIGDKDKLYFERLEATIGIPITPPRRAWYVNKRDTDFSGDQEMMWSQFPSLLDEAFAISTEGVYLVDQLSLARRQSRITKVPYDPAYPVNTFWDLGLDDDMAIWFHQQIGPRDHFINYFEGSGEAYDYFTRHLFSLPYTYGQCFLPHDAGHRRPGAEQLKTIADMLADLGVRNIEIVPRTQDLNAAINQLRMNFNTYWFDEEHCKEGIVHLENYRKAWNPQMGLWSAIPQKNGHQHAADALRQRSQVTGPIGVMASKPKRRNRGGMAA